MPHGGVDRAALRAALVGLAPWLTDPQRGPTTVDAGSCDRCGQRPRLLATCGPTGAPAVCRRCLDVLGDDAWCDGHLDEGRASRAWAATLPDRWGDLVVLWWLATGEVRPDPGSGALPVDPTGLPSELRAALPPG